MPWDSLAGANFQEAVGGFQPDGSRPSVSGVNVAVTERSHNRAPPLCQALC